MTCLHTVLGSSAAVCMQTRRSIDAPTRHVVIVHVLDERPVRLTALRCCRLPPYQVKGVVKADRDLSKRSVKFGANQAGGGGGGGGGGGNDRGGNDRGNSDSGAGPSCKRLRGSGDSGGGGGSAPAEATAAPLADGEREAPADGDSDDPSWEADFTLPAGALEAAQLWDGCASSHPS